MNFRRSKNTVIFAENKHRMIDSAAFENECTFRTSRSSGKGGQHVNKTETKVGLWFDVAASVLFSDEEKTRILSRLASAITDDGFLQLNCDGQRSQLQNKQSVIERAINMLEKSLVVAKPRKRTKPSKAVVEKRLEEKRRQSLKKSERNRLDV
jgi:ribosome-associated protein